MSTPNSPIPVRSTQKPVSRSINLDIINNLIDDLSLDNSNPEWADLSHHFQSIENTVVEKSMPYPSVSKLSQLLRNAMNFAKTIPSTNHAPDEPTCLEKLQAMWWISKVIYAFIDKKNQILPEDCVNDLTSWYLNCLGDFQRLLKLSQFDEMTDNTARLYNEGQYHYFATILQPLEL